MTRPPLQDALPLDFNDELEAPLPDESDSSMLLHDGQNKQAELEGRRRVQGGVTTSDLIFSAYVAGNAEVFPKVLALHVRRGATVADVTWGQGTFWKNVPPDAYQVLPGDIDMGIDFRNLPYQSESLDCVVLDPPYMEGLHRRDEGHLAGSGSHTAFREHYSNGKATTNDGPKWHAAVLDLYVKAGQEACRVLRQGGILIVKCQDEVSANRQWMTHIGITNAYAEIGYYAKDLFVVIRSNRPVVSRMFKQVHARKNHSYFLVFEKSKKPDRQRDNTVPV